MPDVTAAGVILFEPGPSRRFLLMRHHDRWDLPKGHLDPGETLLGCALREMHEETGVLPAQVEIDPGFRFTIQYPVTYRETGPEVFTKTLTIYLGWLPAPVQIVPTEHPDYRWFDWAPPHHFDHRTIDPLLARLAAYFKAR